MRRARAAMGSTPWGAAARVVQREMLNWRLWQQKYYFTKALAPSTALTPLFVSKSSELLLMEADAFPRTLVAFCAIRVVSKNFITQRMTGINFGCQKAMHWVSTRLTPIAANDGYAKDNTTNFFSFDARISNFIFWNKVFEASES